MKKNILVQNFRLTWIAIILMPVLIGGMIFFKDSKYIQFQILILGSLVYVFTALLHHWQDKTLTFEIIIEYILIAVLAIVIVQGVFF